MTQANAVQAGRFKPSRGKKQRRPTHRFFVSHYPWELQPVAIAPVLPGERLLNVNWQQRAVTDPLASSIIGWWLENYLFYVPLSMLGTSIETQVEAGDIATVIKAATASSASTYYAGRGVDWMKACRDLIVKEWFREENEQASTIEIRAGYPAVKINLPGVEHSLRLTSDYPGTDGGALGATQRAQEDAYRSYEFLREQGLIQMTYEDYLGSYGVNDPGMARTRPYLLRYTRDWQYPSNTVNQTTGIPVTAVSWALTNRADKRRFFKEPGFVVMLSSARPKVYRSNQEAHGASIMDRLQYWLPALLREDPLTSLRMDTATSSPLYDTVMTANNYVDVRDLLIHGDQYLSGTSQANAIALPTAAGEHKYATQAMAETLFTNPGSLGLFFVRQDGTIRFDIQAATEDATDATAAS